MALQVAAPAPVVGRPTFLLEALRERDLEADLNAAASYEPPQLPKLTDWHLQFLRRPAGQSRLEFSGPALEEARRKLKDPERGFRLHTAMDMKVRNDDERFTADCISKSIAEYVA